MAARRTAPGTTNQKGGLNTNGTKRSTGSTEASLQRMRDFAHEYHTNGANATAAAIEAGYSGKAAAADPRGPRDKLRP